MLGDSKVLIDGVTEAVKQETKKIRRLISWCFVSSLDCFIQPAISSVIKIITGKKVMRADKGYMDKGVQFCSTL